MQPPPASISTAYSRLSRQSHYDYATELFLDLLVNEPAFERVMETSEATCECKGTGFIAVADNGGEGVEHIECGSTPSV